MCCSDCVSQECCGRLPDARHARQSEELQTSVRQASPRSGCAKSASQAQRRVSRIREPRDADTHRALMAVSEMNDMGHDVFFPRSDRGIRAYAYHKSSGTKLELERVNGVSELPSNLSRAARVHRRTAHQVRILHFLLWNRSRT